ncbi:MAG: hypothetical protein EXR79_17640 [Myxococcales bacterium]|nr:hypothetical protein [Myxococcales bacterium]
MGCHSGGLGFRPMEHATKIERGGAPRDEAVAGDSERARVLARARSFKRSWIDLAEALARVRSSSAFRRWGYESFDDYCTRELSIKKGTADKLCASYGFLRAHAPRLATRGADGDDVVDDSGAGSYDDATPLHAVPSWQAVNFAVRAEERGAADDDTMATIKRAVFDEGAPMIVLQRRFREVAFPMEDQEKRDRMRAQIRTAARRLADLVAQPEAALSRALAERVQESLGELGAALAE